MAYESCRYGTGDTHLHQHLSRNMEHVGCRNLDGISMNIQEENSACYFWVQSERDQTLVVYTKTTTIMKKAGWGCLQSFRLELFFITAAP